MNQEKNRAKYTYCNPLSIPDIPRGKDEWYKYEYGMFSHENKPSEVTSPDYRSISDPTVFYHDGKWYLYPSYGMAWVSEDFQNWKHVRTEPYCPKYSPCIIPWKDKFLMTSWVSPLYVSDSPLGPFEEMGEFINTDGTPFRPCDPAIFADDDGRIYLYAYACPQNEKGVWVHSVVGYELDRDDPRRVIRGPISVVEMDPLNKPWERHGLHNQDLSYGWVEGPHMLKYRGRYYMIYAAPDTCDASYCMAVYYSDKSPLDGFVCQKRNPLTFHRGGIVSGAGHGCVERGPKDTLWAFYTIAMPCLHRYERRIGMDLVDVDEHGELYCPHGVTDTPQYIPGYKENPSEENDIGYVSLTGAVRPEASSERDGHFAIYATDENNLSWWEPKRSDKHPTLECDLSGTYSVGAVRVFWRDVGLDYGKGRAPKPIRYVVEGCFRGEWKTLVDKSQNKDEMNIDYQTFDETPCDKVRLKIVGHAKNLHVGVIDFAVYGRSV